MRKSRILPIFFLLLCITTFAQEKKQDTTKKSHLFLGKVTHKILTSISGDAPSMVDSNILKVDNNIEQLTKFKGKQINNIQIEQHNFNTSINKPEIVGKNLFTLAANKFHKVTQEETIRKNLFFTVSDNINPTIIAYNEKWLRDLPYLQDAKILVNLLKYDTNKVDIVIITKDIFSYGGNFQIKNENSYAVSLSNINVLGYGNSVKINHNFDKTRIPNPGYGYAFSLNNVLGSFIQLNAGLDNFTNNWVDGTNSALKQYINAQLPLLHPYSNWTGGFELFNFINRNVYPSIWEDSTFNDLQNYQLNHADFWLGYQVFNLNKIFQRTSFRNIIQYRHLENLFETRPSKYLEQLDKNYQNINANFISLTFFKQEIIRTKYLYGFGRNEDLPIGQSFVITAGNYKKEMEQLPYFGLKYERYHLTHDGQYLHSNLNIGSSYFKNELQDIRFLSSLEIISKLKYFKNSLANRQLVNLSFTQTLKNKFNEALLINSAYGIPPLNQESIRGGTRISANWESVFYNPRSLYGFKSSPFVFANLTYMRSRGEKIKTGEIFMAFGSGVRIRNENLVFGTIELKGYYFPRTQLQGSPWNFSLLTNLRFKYNSALISKPDFVEIN